MKERERNKEREIEREKQRDMTIMTIMTIMNIMTIMTIMNSESLKKGCFSPLARVHCPERLS